MINKRRKNKLLLRCFAIVGRPGMGGGEPADNNNVALIKRTNATITAIKAGKFGSAGRLCTQTGKKKKNK
jgi:hypothetical protein